MDRREWLAAAGALSTSAMLAGLSPREQVEAAALAHRRAMRAAERRVLSAPETALVTALGDAILPRTDTPSASDAGVPAFVDHMLADWYSAAEREQVRRGLAAIDALARAREGGRFAELGSRGQTAVLVRLDGKRGPEGSAEHELGRLKSLIIHGYFTSERIQKDVLRTVVIPGTFDGCTPFPAG